MVGKRWGFLEKLLNDLFEGFPSAVMVSLLLHRDTQDFLQVIGRPSIKKFLQTFRITQGKRRIFHVRQIARTVFFKTTKVRKKSRNKSHRRRNEQFSSTPSSSSSSSSLPGVRKDVVRRRRKLFERMK